MLTLAATLLLLMQHIISCVYNNGEEELWDATGKTDGWMHSLATYEIYDAIHDDTALTATVCKATIIIISAKIYKLSTKCLSSICLFVWICVCRCPSSSSSVSALELPCITARFSLLLPVHSLWLFLPVAILEPDSSTIFYSQFGLNQFSFTDTTLERHSCSSASTRHQQIKYSLTHKDSPGSRSKSDLITSLSMPLRTVMGMNMMIICVICQLFVIENATVRLFGAVMNEKTDN